MANKFAKLTNTILKKLPTWFKMRRDKNSVGAQFLNVFGLGLDDVQYILDQAYSNYFIGSADENQIDIIYKAMLPGSITPDLSLEFVGGNYTLEAVSTLQGLFTGMDSDNLGDDYREIFYANPYFMDYERNIVYVQKPYNNTLKMTVRDVEGNIILTQDLALMIHHVWNFFDEFGLLLDTPRLHGERNVDYKARILGVFKHPANATKLGLKNGIARELGLTKQVTWKDGGTNLTLREPRVVINTLDVDGDIVNSDRVYIDNSGRTIILGDPDFSGMERVVTYIAGLELHEMHDRTDLAFQQELFDANGLATQRLRYYADLITNKVPVMWDKFIWGEGFWDIADKDMSGYGLIPSFTDARISDWKNYKPNTNPNRGGNIDG